MMGAVATGIVVALAAMLELVVWHLAFRKWLA